MREKQGKKSDFFDEFNWQGIGELSDLTSTHTLKPEEKAIADAKIFGVADCITLGDFGRAVAVGIGDGEVLSGAEHGGGGVVVGHEKKIAHPPHIARKKIIFFQKKIREILKKTLDTLPHFSKKMRSFERQRAGGTLSSISPRPIHVPLPPFVENVSNLSNFTNTKHKKKSQPQKV